MQMYLFVGDENILSLTIKEMELVGGATRDIQRSNRANKSIQTKFFWSNRKTLIKFS